MKHVLIAVAMALSIAAAPASTDESATVDHTASLTPGQSETFESFPVPGGANALYFDQGGVGGDEHCSKSPDTYCEHILVELTNPVPEDDEDGKLVASFSAELTTEAADYDVILYASDAEGTIGDELGRSTQFPIGDTSESVFTLVTTTDEQPSTHVLLRVIFFAPVTPHTTTVSFN